jgi:hypothetical protein
MANRVRLAASRGFQRGVVNMQVNIEELLKYFDIKESSDYGDTTAAISVVGEDLSVALFQHYCKHVRGSEAKVIDANEEIPTTGKKKGPRLDRWILEQVGEKQILYQAEIKSWCARAIGGLNVPLKISDAELQKLTARNWNNVHKGAVRTSVTLVVQYMGNTMLVRGYTFGSL